MTPRLETPDDPSEKEAKPSETEPNDGDNEKGKAKAPTAESAGKDSASKSTGEKGSLVSEKPELPVEVKAKLRRLDKLEVRYNGTISGHANADK